MRGSMVMVDWFICKETPAKEKKHIRTSFRFDTLAAYLIDIRVKLSSSSLMKNMLVEEIMTHNVATCTPQSTLKEVAQQMIDYDCGEIPVVESASSMRVVGVITDRDIAVRGVAKGISPEEGSAKDCMTSNVHTVTLKSTVETVMDLMEDKQVRRVPVVDDSGNICGIVAQADVARHAREDRVAEVVKDISK
jgi:CBS domain-containing protein